MSLNNNFVLYLVLLSLIVCLYQLLILILRCCKNRCQFLNCNQNSQQQQQHSPQNQHRQQFYHLQQRLEYEVNFADQTGNLFSMRDEAVHHQHQGHYNDIFFIETANAEAARRHLQLENDDKDLPSYEEVMRGLSSSPVTPPLGNNVVNQLMGSSCTRASNGLQCNTVLTMIPPVVVPPPYSEATAATVIESSSSSTSSSSNQLPNASVTTTAHSSRMPSPINTVKPLSSATVSNHSSTCE